MDKSIYRKRNVYKLFGHIVFERNEEYEGCDIEDCVIIDPLIEQPINLTEENKKD